MNKRKSNEIGENVLEKSKMVKQQPAVPETKSPILDEKKDKENPASGIKRDSPALAKHNYSNKEVPNNNVPLDMSQWTSSCKSPSSKGYLSKVKDEFAKKAAPDLKGVEGDAQNDSTSEESESESEESSSESSDST